MTRYAEQIWKLIYESQAHMTAEQIFLELKREEPKVALATVYNNLNGLCRDGLIRKVSIEGEPDRYDTVEKHDHLVCKSCGKISDISFGDLTGRLEEQLGEGILSYDLKVFYVCPQCRKKEGKDSAKGAE